MTTTTQIHTAIAQRLAEQGVGTYRPTGVYTAAETGITIKAVPQSPDRIIAITVYDVDEDPDPTNPWQAFIVQLRYRAGKYPTDVDDIADAAHTALTVHHQTWGTVRVDRCHRQSFIPIGADANGRQERTDNYRLVTQY